MKKYKSTNLSDKNAQKVGLFIEQKFPNGEVTPEFLLEYAKPKKSPLHNMFDWDDSVAAVKWRVHQARMILAHLLVETEDGKDIKAFYNLSAQNEDHKARNYYSFDRASSNNDLWDQIIQTALRELEVWQARYKTYKQLKPTSIIIEKHIKKIRKKYGH